MFEREGLSFFLAPAAAGWALLAAAPFVGSFLGVVIRRLPEGRPVFWGRSRCEGCGRALLLRDLVPLFGWIAGKGRCRHCGARLGFFYPGVEIAAVAVAALALAVDGGEGAGERAWLDAALGWWLLALGWIDLRCGLLPDALTLTLVLAGLGAAAAFDPGSLLSRALGAILGYIAFAAIAFVYRRLRGREGLGEGDAKLFAAAGAWVGAAALPSVVLAAAAAALAAALLVATRRRMGAQSPLPFGPFLGLAAWLVWLFGPLAF